MTAKRKVYFGEIYSCDINYQDELLKEQVALHDTIVHSPQDADVIIFSGTCSSTQINLYSNIIAMQEDLEQIKDRSKVKVYLTGCLARPFSMHNKFLDWARAWINENIDVIIPEELPYRLLDMLYPNSEYQRLKDNFGAVFRYEDDEFIDFYVSIGCNNHCSFCNKATYHKAPVRSMKIQDIKNEIDYINENGGIDRLNLNGANLSELGFDEDGKYHLPEIIEYLEGKDNIKTVGLHAMAFSDAIREGFASVLKDSSKVVSIGAALESGSPRLLRLMQKGFKLDDYLEFVKTIQSKYAKELTLSIIAGFPTETLKDVKMTLDTLKEINPTEVAICRYTDTPFLKPHQYEQLTPEEIEDHTRIYNSVLTRRKVKTNIYLEGYKYNKKR